MLIQYETESVRKAFSDFGWMQKKIGKDTTRAIKKRLDQLRASLSFSIYLAADLGKPHSLAGDFKGYYGIAITGNVRLIIKPNAANLTSETLKNCDTVIIKGVVDYHGGKNEWLVP